MVTMETLNKELAASRQREQDLTAKSGNVKEMKDKMAEIVRREEKARNKCSDLKVQLEAQREAIENIMTEDQREQLRVHQAHQFVVEQQRKEREAANEQLRGEMQRGLAELLGAQQDKHEETDGKEEKDPEENTVSLRSTEEAHWIKMKAVIVGFNESEQSVDIKTAIARIGDLVVQEVAAVASQGVLSPDLIRSLKGLMINASWKDMNSMETVHHFHDEDVYVFVQLLQNVSSESRGCLGCSTEWTAVSGETKMLYIEAGNGAARDQLAIMKRQNAEDTFAFLCSLSGWNGMK